jgi:UDP-3-O-[3-hydroxymyristoyl] glucosamine N-acyltransferase
MKLKTIANQLGYTYQGDGNTNIEKFCAIDKPQPNSIAYLRDKKFLASLNSQKDIAVIILTPENAKNYSSTCLLADKPYLAFSKISRLLSPDILPKVLIHPSAVVDKSAVLGTNVHIGPNCVIDENTMIYDNVTLQANCSIGCGTVIGESSYIFANVTINHQCILGARVRIQSGAVIGSEGFGYAKHKDGWSRIAQAGKVVIGDDVEIGANTTIDRGAIDDTTIANGVILDNQIQIAHNVQIGENTAMAGCVGVAGSAIIGKNCTVGGATVILGHLNIVDNVHITAMSLVTKSINKAGQYSSGGILEESSAWRKNTIRFKQLDKLFKKLKNI